MIPGSRSSVQTRFLRGARGAGCPIRTAAEVAGERLGREFPNPEFRGANPGARVRTTPLPMRRSSDDIRREADTAANCWRPDTWAELEWDKVPRSRTFRTKSGGDTAGYVTVTH